MKKNAVKMVTSVMLCLYTTMAYCVERLPAAIFATPQRLYEYRWLGILASSIVVEAALFYWFLKNVSYARAILIACLGKAVSVLMNLVMVFGAILAYHVAYRVLPDVIISYINISHNLELIVTYILMYLGSALIELFVIQKIFRYPYKDLWIPICVGNLVTYSLIATFLQPTKL